MQIISAISKKIKQSEFKYICLVLLVMVLWGFLYPAVKFGYKALSIDTSNPPQILLFAGLRFFICGTVITIIAALTKKGSVSIKNNIFSILCMGMLGIVVHYSLTYIGLTSVDSSKTAILKKVGELIYICFSFLIIREEKFAITKVIGSFIGFAGVIALNITPEGRVSFSLGDGMIILASIAGICSSLLCKKAIKTTSPIMVTGVSQLFGGIVLIALARLLNAPPISFSSEGVFILCCICLASIVSYCIWYYAMGKILLSKMYILKFAEPFFACIFGAIMLKENIFTLQYLLAFILIITGVIIGVNNKPKRGTR